MRKTEPLTLQVELVTQGRKVQDNIPAGKGERNRLLRIIREYVKERRPVGPLSKDELERHAQNIIAISQTEEKYRNYIGVLINNEVWREALAGTPFARRLLLLPKCLRDEQKCQGQLDAYGLVCRHCDQCMIGDVQSEAEGLGYVVMVAEGSPMVMSLIESGKIEAVVGVSCMSVLEQVFPYMETAAAPGIAIPLLQDGCRNTSVDLDWVWDAIHLSGKKETYRLNPDRLRRQVDLYFGLESLRNIMGASQGETQEIACEWLSKSGKRWRPFLTACVIQSLNGQDDETISTEAARLAVAVECFHKASLIHDDIEDNDPLRYGRETVHAKYGIEIALNVGDFLLGEGYRLIGQCCVSSDQKVRMLQAAADGHRTLCLGQGAELCWRRNPEVLRVGEILEIFRQKTAPAFEVALHLGAIYAGTDDDLCQVLRKYSEALGIAYQIYDDLQDFKTPDETGDILAMRPSLLLGLAYEQAKDDQRSVLEAFWQRAKQFSKNESEMVNQILWQTGSVETAENLIELYKNQAIRSLSELKNSNLKGLLRRVIGKIFNDIESMVCCNEYKAANNTDSTLGSESAE